MHQIDVNHGNVRTEGSKRNRRSRQAANNGNKRKRENENEIFSYEIGFDSYLLQINIRYKWHFTSTKQKKWR